MAGVQRYQTVAIKPETGSISPKRSLAVPVQFRDFFIAKSPKRTFAGDNRLLTVAVNNAAEAAAGL